MKYAGYLLLLCVVANQCVTAQPFTRIVNDDFTSENSFSAGISLGDVNNDGFVDIYVAKGTTIPRLFLNNGSGGFQRVNSGDITTAAANNGSSGAWADYNNDGYLDLYVSNKGIPPANPGGNFLFRNSGPPDYTLQRILNQPVDDVQFINHTYTSSWVDYDNDGDLDLHVIENGYQLDDYFFENDGSGNFQATEAEFVKPGTMPGAAQANWLDYDNDGDQDVLLTQSGRPHGGEENQLYQNMLSESGSLGFTEITDSGLNHFGLDYSASWGDFDNDSDLDVLLGNFDGTNFLFRNVGGNNFTQITSNAVAMDNVSTQGSGWADYDNDGDLDLYTVTSNTSTNAPGGPGRLFRNDGPQGFTLTTGNEVGAIATLSALGMGGAWADVDNDGDMDLLVTNAANDFLLRNDQSNGNHWIMFNLEGRTSNRSAVGARLFITATVNGSSVTQMRHVTGSPTGDRSQSDMRVHLGLADATAIQSLRIQWPSGIEEIYPNLEANRIYRVIETVGAQAEGDFIINPGLGGTWFNPATVGQGLVIEVIQSRNLLIAAWFTFNELGGTAQRWFTLRGPITGNQATLEIFTAEDGRFDQSDPVTNLSPGTAELEFEDCSTASLSYAFENGPSGVIPLSRLTPADSCEALLLVPPVQTQ